MWWRAGEGGRCLYNMANISIFLSLCVLMIAQAHGMPLPQCTTRCVSLYETCITNDNDNCVQKYRDCLAPCDPSASTSVTKTSPEPSMEPSPLTRNNIDDNAKKAFDLLTLLTAIMNDPKYEGSEEERSAVTSNPKGIFGYYGEGKRPVVTPGA